MATLKVVLNPGGAGIASKKLAPPTPSTYASHSLNKADGTPTVDLDQGCASGATIVGPSRIRTAGQEVVVCGQSTAAGTLTVETSTDSGATWTNADSDSILASVYVVSRTTTVPTATHYRIKFTCGPNAASVVEFHTQCRP